MMPVRNLMPWDELNVIRDKVSAISRRHFTADDAEEILDELFDLFILAYLDGVEQTNGDLKTDVQADADQMHSAVNRRIDGEDFRDRVRNYCAEDDADGIMKVAETEMHFCFNSGAYDTAEKARLDVPVYKKWYTMRDERVRDTHNYLEGMVVGLDDKFYTDDGDSARFPGDFSLPENNINCRCGIGYTTEGM